ncbi:hypothetical protein FG386_000702 [Cryptosporidium ryanae]|uniref:uncharacterized protein n=1 Tax=Cryptosporidium ryanae TaxID=515981 RepID=UPI003519DBB8|nr:hypothetical protein FG386_000702 [Cryptosporidium ryanae]
MNSNNYNEATDLSDVSMRLSDSLYNEGGIPDYLFSQGNDDGSEDVFKSDSVPVYYEDQDKILNGGFCSDSNIDLISDIAIPGSQSRRKSSISSNNSESRGSVRGKQDVTTEEDIPEQVTYTSGDSGIKYRYIVDFCIYNNKLSRLVPLDSLPNKYESIYFNGERSTLDYFVTFEGSNNGNSISENKTEANYEEFTMTGSLVPADYILNYEKEKSTVLRDNYRKLLKARQKGGVSSGFKPKKVKEIPKSVLRQEGLNSFSIKCRIHSWTIEFGSNIYDSPYIWVNSMPVKGGQKVCYRLIWPANKYSKYYSAAKLKFDIISRLIKTLLSPNSNRIGYKTFLDQVTGKTQNSSSNKKQLVSTETECLNVANEDNSDQVSAGSTTSGGTPMANSTSKKLKKESIGSSNDANSSTVWGDSVCVPGSTERDVLLMYNFIEYYLKAYSERHNLSKVLGVQILITMKNKLVKMISSEDSSLNESDISSNLDNYLKNVDLMDKIFSYNKLQGNTIGFGTGNGNDMGVANVGNNNLKRRRSSVSKAEDALKNYLPKIKCYADSFDNCLSILKISFFLGVYGEYLDLPVNSSSLLSIQSYYSRVFPENKSTCIEIIKCFYSEYKRIIERQQSSSKESGRKVIQQDLVEFINIVNMFPESSFFSISSKMVSFISEKLLPSKLGLTSDGASPENNIGGKQTKKTGTSLLFNTETNATDIHKQHNLFPEFNDSLLDDIVNKNYVDNVTWPVILGEIQKRLESVSNDFEDLGDEEEDDDQEGKKEEGTSEDLPSGNDTNHENRASTEEENYRNKNASFWGYAKNDTETMFYRDSLLDAMSWMVDELFGDKLGKEFLDQISLMQNASVNSSSGKKKVTASIGRNDNLIGTDRYSNKYYAFNNIKTTNTLNKSLVIVPSCSEGLNNDYLTHKHPCSNPICTKAPTNKNVYLSSYFYGLENKRVCTVSNSKGKESQTSCYRYLTKKKELDTLITCLNEEHYCEFQLKLKLKSIFCGKELEHQQFDPEEYVKYRISRDEKITVPFGFSPIGMDMEKQYIYFSLLSLIKQVSVIYAKMLFPLLVCARNDLETHFRIMDYLFKLSLTIFELFINSSGITCTALMAVLEDMVLLIKLVSESTVDCLSVFGIAFDKTQEKNYKLWLSNFERNVNMEGRTRDGLGLALGRKISAMCLYLKIFVFRLIPRDIVDMSFGRNYVSPFDFNKNCGYVLDRDTFVSTAENGSDGRFPPHVSCFIPKQSETLYYLRSGHLLVVLDWINSIISERKGCGEAYVRFIEHFCEPSEDLSPIEKVLVESICYNFGDEHSGGEGEKIALTPFVLLNCKLLPRKNETVPDDIESQLGKLKRNIDTVESLGKDFVSRKRTSNRIKNNNLSNSYREAIIADSTFTIAESRESFVRSNIRYIKKSRNDDAESLNVSLILPLRLCSNKKSGFAPGPFGRSITTTSTVQKKSLEIRGFQPTTPFYLVNDSLFRDSIEKFLSRDGSRIGYFIGDKINHGIIIRMNTDGDDIWDCILVENDDVKNKERSIVSLNLWQIILD